MDIRIQILIGIGIVFALIYVFFMIRGRRLELKYALPWITVLIAVLIVNCFPMITTKLSNAVGISTPINMLFFLGFCFSLCIIMGLTTSVSRMSNKVKKLTQEMALVKKEIEEVKQEEKEQAK